MDSVTEGGPGSLAPHVRSCADVSVQVELVVNLCTTARQATRYHGLLQRAESIVDEAYAVPDRMVLTPSSSDNGEGSSRPRVQRATEAEFDHDSDPEDLAAESINAAGRDNELLEDDFPSDSARAAAPS